MKKQLFLLLTILSIGLSSSLFAQERSSTLAPRPVTCLTSDALHPIAGTPYNYIVDVPTPAGTKSYTWLVTQDQTFVTNGALVATPQAVGGPILAAADTWYNTATVNQPTISLTWQSFAYNPANPVFVVIFVTNDDATGTGCTTQNVKVYKIEPQNSFTLDLANLTANGSAIEPGYGTVVDRCMSDIVSATYDANAPEGVLYDFGVNYLYFIMTAANWSEAYNFTIQLTNVDPLEHVTVEWSNASDFSGAVAMAGPTVGTGATPAVYTNTTNVTPLSGTFVGAGGQDVFIRVTLDHSVAGLASWQGLTAQNINLAVDAVTVPTTGTGIGDIHTSDNPSPAPGVPACPWVDGFVNDIAYQTLQPRPTINAGATMPAPGLLPVKP